MKIAFLGKGGSGKSSLATSCVRFLHARGDTVLAIDADHNMDLAFNLGSEILPAYLGTDPSAIKAHLGMSRDESFADTTTQAKTAGKTFTLSPKDAYTQSFSIEVEPRLHLMAAGPHTDDVRFGGNCSHSLAAPLKVYLPLLTLASHEWVVIDERAGTDPVATGILNGIDLAVIVVEPTVHSARVGKQIAAELAIAKVPHVFVANKVTPDTLDIFASLAKVPAAHIPFSAERHVPDSAYETLLASAAH